MRACACLVIKLARVLIEAPCVVRSGPVLLFAMLLLPASSGERRRRFNQRGWMDAVKIEPRIIVERWANSVA